MTAPESTKKASAMRTTPLVAALGVIAVAASIVAGVTAHSSSNPTPAPAAAAPAAAAPAGAVSVPAAVPDVSARDLAMVNTTPGTDVKIARNHGSLDATGPQSEHARGKAQQAVLAHPFLKGHPIKAASLTRVTMNVGEGEKPDAKVKTVHQFHNRLVWAVVVGDVAVPMFGPINADESRTETTDMLAYVDADTLELLSFESIVEDTPEPQGPPVPNTAKY